MTENSGNFKFNQKTSTSFWLHVLFPNNWHLAQIPAIPHNPLTRAAENTSTNHRNTFRTVCIRLHCLILVVGTTPRSIFAFWHWIGCANFSHNDLKYVWQPYPMYPRQALCRPWWRDLSSAKCLNIELNIDNFINLFKFMFNIPINIELNMFSNLLDLNSSDIQTRCTRVQTWPQNLGCSDWLPPSQTHWKRHWNHSRMPKSAKFSSFSFITMVDGTCLW